LLIFLDTNRAIVPTLTGLVTKILNSYCEVIESEGLFSLLNYFLVMPRYYNAGYYKKFLLQKGNRLK